MALDRTCAEPQFPDFENVAAFSTFVASLREKKDDTSCLVKDLYIHERVLQLYAVEEALLRSLLRTRQEVVNEIVLQIGEQGWNALNTIYDNREEGYWKLLHHLIECVKPCPESIFFGEIDNLI